jgi:hypothetical protein
MMLRYTMSFFEPVGIERDDDGEYVLYEQHIEEGNRIRAEARAEMEAENKRLREALEGIMAIAGNPNAIAACRLIIKEARAALGKE